MSDVVKNAHRNYPLERASVVQAPRYLRMLLRRHGWKQRQSRVTATLSNIPPNKKDPGLQTRSNKSQVELA